MVHETIVQNSRIAQSVRWTRVNSPALTEAELLVLVKKGEAKAYQVIVQKYMQTA